MENQEPNVKQAYSKMAQLCSRSEQCSADIRKKIMAYEIVEEIVDEIINAFFGRRLFSAIGKKCPIREPL